MQRSKQQALMFLLGSVLVGGALGFTADRYIGHEKFASQYGPRTKFYDELGLSDQQRATLDSLEFEQDCAMRAALAPRDSAVRAIRARFRAEQHSVLTPQQLARLDARRKEIQARHAAEQAKEPRKQCSGN